MFRQLITEGIATFVSMKIADVDKWYLGCENRESELAKYAIDNFSNSLTHNSFFKINDNKFGNRK